MTLAGQRQVVIAPDETEAEGSKVFTIWVV